jgi:aspartate carbamoyltransferase catalytic subunit
MNNKNEIQSINKLVQKIGLVGESVLSISDMSDDQIYNLFELAKTLEPWNRSKVELLPDKVLLTIFFQPSTRTRMSFETAMQRLGGMVVSEADPMTTSSAAKEESLADMMKVVSKYANVIVLRHFDDQEALNGAKYSEAPVINGGFGDWEHPTQALLDLYTLWRIHGKVEDLKVCVASADLIAARTGHSMAHGLTRLGAKVTLASPKKNRTPKEVREKLDQEKGEYTEAFDLNQDEFNELIKDVDLVYLPGCSAPKGPESEAFKEIMDNYFVRYEALDEVYQETGKNVRVTHTLPRRAGEMDLKIDTSRHQQYFEAIAYSVSLRMALLVAVVGL